MKVINLVMMVESMLDVTHVLILYIHEPQGLVNEHVNLVMSSSRCTCMYVRR